MNPNEVIRIINNMSDSDKCSDEDDSASDDDTMSEHAISDNETTYFEDDQPIEVGNYLHILSLYVNISVLSKYAIIIHL